MDHPRGRLILAAALVIAALSVTLAPAAEAPAPGDLVSTWVFWPKAGENAALEAGIKAHAAWRKSAGEGLHWDVYQPVVGKDLSTYVIRAEGLHWSDFDREDAWEQSSGALAKYMEQMGVHVDRVEHYIGQLDMANSMWQENPNYRYYAVSAMVARPGMHGDIVAGLAKVHKTLSDKKWSHSYGIEWQIGGGEAMFLVEPFVNYAGMAEPDPSFMKVMSEALGAADAAATMKQLSGSFSSSDYTIYVHRPDLSTPK
ncbi:MAG: hypothetical protein ACM3OB_02385 [Acidobacteriota bacterium]